jgi:hypothetical protein
MIKEEIVKYSNSGRNNIPLDNISSLPDFEKLVLPYNLPEKIEKIDHTNLNIENFNKSCPGGLEVSSPLQFDLQPLINLNISDFISLYAKNTTGSTNSSSSTKGLFFFVIVKYLTQLSDLVNGTGPINLSINNQGLNMNEETLMKKLNEMYLSLTESEVFWSYRHKLLNSNLNLRFENIIKDKEMFIKNFTYERTIEMIKQKLIKVLCPSKENNSTNSHLLELGIFFESYFINSLSFIHFNEYMVLLEKGCVDYKQRLEISLLQLILLSSYYIWRNSIKTKVKADFKFDEIINYFFKYSIINTLELVINAGNIENFVIEKVNNNGSIEDEDIKAVNINLITCLFRNLMKIIFEIEINSKEV